MTTTALRIDHTYCNDDVDDGQDAFGIDLAAELSSHVVANWADNGIGSYEFWGAHGVHEDWRLETEPTQVVVDVTGCEVVPVGGKFSTTIGGCDGEHRGRCRRECHECEVEYSIELQSVVRQDGKLLAVYIVG